MQINRHTFPPNGWVFYQPQTKWRNPMPLGFTFEQSVEVIIKHRMANKAIALKYGLSTDFNTVADELERYTRLRLGIPEEEPSKKAQTRSALVRGVDRVAAVAASIRKVAVGAATVSDCVGSDPVPQEEAERRAAICVKCPMNGKGDFTSWFTVPLSEAIRKAESKLRSRNLSTSVDDKLGVCEACLCPLRLKSFCSLKVIREHMIPEVLKELHTDCWITK